MTSIARGRHERLLVWACLTCVLALPAGLAQGMGSKSRVQLALLRYAGGNPLPRPTALRRLAWEIDKRTSVNVAAEPIEVTLGDPRLFAHPLLYLGGDRAFPLPNERDLTRLRRYLVYGGTLVVDSAEARPGGGFDESVRALVTRLFPKQGLSRIKSGHTVHKSFYLLERPVGRVDMVPYLEGVERDGRMVIVYSHNDLAGAWARDNFGQWEYNVHPGGDRQRELAFRWGINLVIYALCIDYKADQVHIPFILKRRRWRVASP